MTRSRFVVVAAALAAGCGAPSATSDAGPDDGGCSYSVSGSTTEGRCKVDVYGQECVTGCARVTVHLVDVSDRPCCASAPLALSFWAELRANALEAQTYTLADTSEFGAAGGFQPHATQPTRWELCPNGETADQSGTCFDNAGQPVANQGDFALEVTDPGPADREQWPAAHGTLKLHLVADPGTPASGAVTVDARF